MNDQMIKQTAAPAISIYRQKHMDKVQKSSRAEYQGVKFQVYHKFGAWGYDSPEDMLEGEPDAQEILNQGFVNRAPNHEHLQRVRERCEEWARQALDLQQTVQTDPNASFIVPSLKALDRKALHELVRNVDGLKSSTVARQGQKGDVCVSKDA